MRPRGARPALNPSYELRRSFFNRPILPLRPERWVSQALNPSYGLLQVDFRAPLPPPPVIEVSPRIEYINQSATGISIAYTDMPVGAEIVLVNGTSGDETTSRIALSQGGAGSLDMAINPGQGGGLYYLLARGQADKQYIAQTVGFYIN